MEGIKKGEEEDGRRETKGEEKTTPAESISGAVPPAAT